MYISEAEIVRLAHIAAHEFASITVKSQVAMRDRFPNPTLEDVYKKAYESIFAFVKKKFE